MGQNDMHFRSPDTLTQCRWSNTKCIVDYLTTQRISCRIMTNTEEHYSNGCRFCWREASGRPLSHRIPQLQPIHTRCKQKEGTTKPEQPCPALGDGWPASVAFVRILCRAGRSGTARRSDFRLHRFRVDSRQGVVLPASCEVVMVSSSDVWLFTDIIKCLWARLPNPNEPHFHREARPIPPSVVQSVVRAMRPNLVYFRCASTRLLPRRFFPSPKARLSGPFAETDNGDQFRRGYINKYPVYRELEEREKRRKRKVASP
jgi:hypothetical protein